LGRGSLKSIEVADIGQRQLLSQLGDSSD
jgi:hypothetical protein